MQKEQKLFAKNKILLFAIFVLMNFPVFSQKTLEGRFYMENWDLTKESNYSYTFSKDGTFKFVIAADVSISKYGQEHYTITEDSLIMNYDLTDIRFQGYDILKPYDNLKDTMELRISVYDLDKKTMRGA